MVTSPLDPISVTESVILNKRSCDLLAILLFRENGQHERPTARKQSEERVIQAHLEFVLKPCLDKASSRDPQIKVTQRPNHPHK